MTSSLSSAAAAACCKRGGGSSSSNPPSPPVARVISSSRRKVVLLLSAAAVVPAGAEAGQASTPYSQSQSQQQFGLDAKGRIRACPSTNPGCVSTNPTVGASCSLASPLIVPANTNTMPDKAAAAASLLRQAILRTQRNAVIKADEDTPYGHYIQAEVDGGLTLTGAARDVMEFLLKDDKRLDDSQLLATYRCVATRVTFVYPFTTAVGDSKGQTQRIAAVFQDLGWYAPDLLNAADATNDH